MKIEKKKVDIIVGICSCVPAAKRRAGVRDSWLKYPEPGIECVFFVGAKTPPQREEHDTVALNALDGYNELPAKVFAFFRHALEHYDFEWLFKCDDDTYLDLSRLKSVADDNYDLIGDVLVQRRSSPSGGAGYFLSRSMVEKIVAMTALPQVGAEDVIVGELVKKLGGSMVYTPRLYLSNAYYPDADNDMVSAHWCTPDMLRAIDTIHHGQPDFIYQGKHSYWEDDILFYANGVFRRKSTHCYGWWKLSKKGRLQLKWALWPTDQLLDHEGVYIGSLLSLTKKETCHSSSESEAAASLPVSNDDDDEYLFVHLGCGKRWFGNWLNLDLPNYDITKPLPWSNNSIDALFLEHVIEMVTANEALHFFKEAWRMLRPGGILRLAITDIELFSKKETLAFRQIIRQQLQNQLSMGNLADSLIGLHGFRSLWTADTLGCLLEAIGFEVTKASPGDSEHPHLRHLERQNDRDAWMIDLPGTACLEAKKPDKANRREKTIQHQSYVSPHFIAGHRTGNRMFQIAAAYAHSLRHGLTCRVPWHHSDEVEELYGAIGGASLACEDGGYDDPIIYDEPTFSYTPIPPHAVNGAVRGFFQSERHFEDFEPEIRHLFHQLVTPRQEGFAGIHLRLGDYLERTEMYRTPDNNFMEQAFSSLSDNIKHLVVFSDDPDKAHEMVLSIPSAKRFEIEIDRNHTIGAIRRMTGMQELVLSCSSFSWWAAYLGNQEKVFIQSPWFAGKISDDHDVYRKQWTQIR